MASDDNSEFVQVVLTTCHTPTEAHMVAGWLEDHGIEAFLQDEFLATMHWGLSGAIAGSKVVVRESDRDAALKLLQEFQANRGGEKALGDESDDFPEPERTSQARKGLRAYLIVGWGWGLFMAALGTVAFLLKFFSDLIGPGFVLAVLLAVVLFAILWLVGRTRAAKPNG